MIVKVCGMRQSDNIRAVEQSGADWLGFIFHAPSPRHIDTPPAYLPVRSRRVGVFVSADVGTIAARQRSFGLDIVQLHGDFTPAFCADLRRALPQSVRLMKMLPVATADDLAATAGYDHCVDYYLLDTRQPMHGTTGTAPAFYGGSGRQFDWTLLDAYRSQRPFLLSGGIGPQDAAAVAALRHPRLAGVDLNSRFETAPGVKDAAAIRTFIDTLSR